jgi:hypothetical protein
VVRELTGQTGQKTILPAGMQLPHMPGRYVIM